MKLKIFFILSILVFAVLVGKAFSQNSTTKVNGFVYDEENKPLVYVNVFILNSFDGAMTEEDGSFSFTTAKNGEVEIAASLVGYKKYSEKFEIKDLPDTLIINLKSEVVLTSEVIVTASSFSSEKEKGVVMTSMDVMTTPGGAADIFQSLKTLPGITQVSESAELYVRGGDPSETLTLFDQATLNHPYTFESAYGGIFSNINTNTIKGMFFPAVDFLLSTVTLYLEYLLSKVKTNQNAE